MNIRFTDTYRCLSAAACGRPELEETSRMLLPEDAINSIVNAGYDFERNQVMFFCVRNIDKGTEAYANVQEFTMRPGQACLPYWLMEFLQCQENDLVNITFTNLPIATTAVLQPLSSTFFQIPDLGVVLEYTFRLHFCLTQGTIIVIKFNNKIYRLKVLKTEPKNGVKIYKSDVAVEFAPAIDEFKHSWNEPDIDSEDGDIQPQVKKGRNMKGEEVTFTEELKPLHSTFAQREEQRLHGNVFRTKEIVQGQEIDPPKPPDDSKKKVEKKAFEGQGHVIKKKKPKKGQPAPPPAPIKVKAQSQETNDAKDKKGETTPAPTKSFFTGTAHTVKGETTHAPPPPKQEPPKLTPEQEKKQQEQQQKKASAFSGPARTIKSPGIQQPRNPNPPPPQQQPQKPSNNQTAPKKNYFEGPSRKIKQ